MRLLVIEDERDLLRSLEMTLTDEGYAVDVAADGEEGLFKSTTWEYDAILLDLMLPRLNGIEVLQRLRREKRVPVLILTARDAVGDRVQGLDLGADDYLIKPFERAELLARLRALIRRSAGQTTACLELGDIRINTASRSVMKGGEVVELSPREYSLLEFLAMHRGQLVTRTMLYDHLFDENEDSLSNLLDVYVARLRKKLGRDMIVTKRGHGYVIDVYLDSREDPVLDDTPAVAGGGCLWLHAVFPRAAGDAERGGCRSAGGGSVRCRSPAKNTPAGTCHS